MCPFLVLILVLIPQQSLKLTGICKRKGMKSKSTEIIVTFTINN